MTISSSPSAQFDQHYNSSIHHQMRSVEKSKEKDSVKMSNDALLLTEAIRAAQSAPDMRMEKVEALKTAIENGTYTIDAKLIAERISEEETSLFI